MKIIQRVIKCIVAALILTVAGATVKVNAASFSEVSEAADEYRKILDEESEGDSDRYGPGYFSIYDLDQDGMPELIYFEESTKGRLYDIYTYRSGKVVKLDNSDKSLFSDDISSLENLSIYQNNKSNRYVECDAARFMEYVLTWKSDDKGWWAEDATGVYPSGRWLEIGESWYYFNEDGYMAENEWIGGWWCGQDGACTYQGVASWKSDSQGWWYQDSLGWYPTSQWQKIDGVWYYFNSDGYVI